MQARRGGAGHFRQCGIGDVRCSGKLCTAKLCGLCAHAVDLVLRHAAQYRGSGVGHRIDHNQVPEAFQEVLHEAAGILSGLDDAVNSAEDRGGVAGSKGVDDVVEQCHMGVAKEVDGELIVQAGFPGAGHQLVQDGEGVADGPAAGPDHEGQYARGNRNAFLDAEFLQVSQQRLRRNQPERVVVRPGTDGANDLVRFRSGKDELDVFRRLFHDLQQGIEPGGGDHVGFIDDEDFVPVPHGGKGGPLAQVAGVVHAAVAGRVDFNDIKAAGAVARQFNAAVACAAGDRRRTLRAV